MATPSISSIYRNFDCLPDSVGFHLMSYVSFSEGCGLSSTNKRFCFLHQMKLREIGPQLRKIPTNCFVRMTTYLDHRDLIQLEMSQRRFKDLTVLGWKAVRKRHYLEYDWEHLAKEKLYKDKKSAALGISLFNHKSLVPLKNLFPQYLELMELSPDFDNYFGSEDVSLPLPSSFGGNLLMQSIIELETQDNVNNSQVLSCLQGAIKAKATWAAMLVLDDDRFTLEEKITLVKASSWQGDERALEQLTISEEFNQLSFTDIKKIFRDTNEIYPSVLFLLFKKIKHDPRRKEYLDKVLVGYGDRIPLNLLLEIAFEFQKEKNNTRTKEIVNRIFSLYSFEVISNGIFSKCQLSSFLDRPQQKTLHDMTIARSKNC